jgi:hypothetical protein
MIDEWNMNMEPWNETYRWKNKVLREKHLPLPLCPLPIPLELAWFQTWAYTVRGWQISTWAKAEPTVSLSLDTNIPFCLWVSTN